MSGWLLIAVVCVCRMSQEHLNKSVCREGMGRNKFSRVIYFVLRNFILYVSLLSYYQLDPNTNKSERQQSFLFQIFIIKYNAFGFLCVFKLMSL